MYTLGSLDPGEAFEVRIDDVPSREEIPDTAWSHKGRAKLAALELAERMADGYASYYCKVRGHYERVEDDDRGREESDLRPVWGCHGRQLVGLISRRGGWLTRSGRTRV
jgi:hypothetical protein